MEKTIVFRPSRRQFLSRIPAAAALCFGCSQGWFLSASHTDTFVSQNTHKFQREIPPVTYSQWAQHRNMKYIGILKHLEKDIGKQRLLELLKKASYAENVALGKRLSQQIDSMHTFAGPFRDEDSRARLPFWAQNGLKLHNLAKLYSEENYLKTRGK